MFSDIVITDGPAGRLDKACIDKATESAGAPGSAAEDYDVLEPGKRKFEAISPMLSGISEELQINAAESNGLGSMEYDLVEVPEKTPADFAFPPDNRFVGVRFREKFEKIPPFPRDRHDGRGFDRLDKVDLKAINAYKNNGG